MGKTDYITAIEISSSKISGTVGVKTYEGIKILATASTPVSGFISKGERAVRDMLCQRKDARFIRVLPSCLPNKRFKPESAYIAPFAQNRYLEIARGNDESEFGRRACLDLNEEIIEIAIAGEGLALYWTRDGLKVLARTEENKIVR